MADDSVSYIGSVIASDAMEAAGGDARLAAIGLVNCAIGLLVGNLPAEALDKIPEALSKFALETARERIAKHRAGGGA